MSMEQGARICSGSSWLTILFSYTCSCLRGRKMQETSYAVQMALKCEKKFFLYKVREVLGWLVRIVTLHNLETMQALFYKLLFYLRKSIVFCKVLRLRPFVLQA